MAMKKNGKSHVSFANPHQVMLFKDISLGPHEAELRFRLVHFWVNKLSIDLEMLLIDEQKRLDQITEQLESGTHEAETNKKTNSDIAEHLELERREAIGEILELNLRFKAPPDYKPLMKEARLPVDVKENSDFSFLSLIFGSQGDT